MLTKVFVSGTKIKSFILDHDNIDHTIYFFDDGWPMYKPEFLKDEDVELDSGCWTGSLDKSKTKHIN